MMTLTALADVRTVITFALFSTVPASAQRTYAGFDCTIDGSGHTAGYQWAERNGITDEADCPLPNNSPSFQEGCIASRKIMPAETRTTTAM
jgi:hypothetical protein